MIGLLKRPYRERQRRWAEALKKRIDDCLPFGLTCVHGGWYPGCEPLLQFRKLEWVDIKLKLSAGCSVAERFDYPAAPSELEILNMAHRLIDCVR